MSSTTSTFPAPITLRPLPPVDHPAYLITSIAMNGFFLCLLICIIYFKCKKAVCRFWQRRRSHDPERNPILHSNRQENFSIADSTSEDENSVPEHTLRPALSRQSTLSRQSANRTDQSSRTNRTDQVSRPRTAQASRSGTKRRAPPTPTRASSLLTTPLNELLGGSQNNGSPTIGAHSSFRGQNSLTNSLSPQSLGQDFPLSTFRPRPLNNVLEFRPNQSTDTMESFL